MARFERLEFCWPPLRSPTPVSGVWPRVHQLWAVRGHLIASAWSSPTEQELIGIDVVPHVESASREVLGSSRRVVEDLGYPVPPGQPLLSSELKAPVVCLHVVDDVDIVQRNQRAHLQTLFAIRDNGVMEVWRYFADTRRSWECVHKGIKLVLDRSITVAAACVTVHDGNAQIYYAEAFPDKSGQSAHDIYMQELRIEQSDRIQPLDIVNIATLKLSVSAPLLIARGMAPCRFAAVADGVVIIPSAPAADTPSSDVHDRLFFWSLQLRELTSMVWGVPLDQGPGAFRTGPIDHKIGYARADSADSADDVFHGMGSSPPRIHAAAVHPLTRELVVLESTGRLIACRLHNGRAHLSALGRLPPGALSARLTRFVVHRTHAALFSHTSCRLYSLRSGAFVRELSYPSLPGSPKVWAQEGAASLMGVYSTGGAWQVQFDRVSLPSTVDVSVSAAASAASPAGAVERVLSAPLVDALTSSRAWSLRRHYAKYLLDAALELQRRVGGGGGDGDTARALMAISETLVHGDHLESPALVVALLRGMPQFDARVRELVAQFLAVFHGDLEREEGQAAEAVGKDGADATPAVKAFRLRTPLNDIIAPMLRSWLATQPQSEPIDTEEQLTLRAHNTAPEVYGILDRAAALFRLNKAAGEWMDRARLEELVRTEPSLVLACIESYLHLDKYDFERLPDGEDALLLDHFFAEAAADEFVFEGHQGHGGRSWRHALFEQLCSLAIAEKPSRVPFFVQLAHHCSMKAAVALGSRGTGAFHSSSRPPRATRKDMRRNLDGFRRRAINAIVPVDATDVLDHRDSAGAIAVIVQLLTSAEEPSRAMRFLLALDRWDEAILMMQNGDRDIVEQVELYHTLLTGFLLSGSSAHAPNLLERIWEVQPKNYSVYDLIELLRHADLGAGAAGSGGQQTILASPHDRLAVGHVRAQLLRMFARETTRRGQPPAVV